LGGWSSSGGSSSSSSGFQSRLAGVCPCDARGDRGAGPARGVSIPLGRRVPLRPVVTVFIGLTPYQLQSRSAGVYPCDEAGDRVLQDADWQVSVPLGECTPATGVSLRQHAWCTRFNPAARECTSATPKGGLMARIKAQCQPRCAGVYVCDSPQGEGARQLQLRFNPAARACTSATCRFSPSDHLGVGVSIPLRGHLRRAPPVSIPLRGRVLLRRGKADLPQHGYGCCINPAARACAVATSARRRRSPARSTPYQFRRAGVCRCDGQREGTRAVREGRFNPAARACAVATLLQTWRTDELQVGFNPAARACAVATGTAGVGHHVATRFQSRCAGVCRCDTSSSSTRSSYGCCFNPAARACAVAAGRQDCRPYHFDVSIPLRGRVPLRRPPLGGGTRPEGRFNPAARACAVATLPCEGPATLPVLAGPRCGPTAASARPGRGAHRAPPIANQRPTERPVNALA
jgi:hypothetical protein